MGFVGFLPFVAFMDVCLCDRPRLCRLPQLLSLLLDPLDPVDPPEEYPDDESVSLSVSVPVSVVSVSVVLSSEE